METTDFELPGHPGGFYAALAQAGLQKAGTLTTPGGERQGVLVDEQGRLVLVRTIKDRNNRGQFMRLTLGLLVGPGFEAE